MVETPQKGETLKSSWAASVARAVNDSSPMGAAGFLARDGVTGRGFEALPQNRRERRAAAGMPMSYEVRYAASVGSSGESSGEKSGAWIMWLGGGQLLSVAGATIDAATVKGDLSDVGSPYPDGWVSLAGVMPATGGQLWMRVTVPKSTDESSSSASSASTPTVEWIVGDTPGESSTKSTVYSIPIALTSRDAETGETKVRQQTHGFVNLTASGGGSCDCPTYVAGDDTNIVFTAVVDEDGNATGKTKVDVYYK